MDATDESLTDGRIRSTGATLLEFLLLLGVLVTAIVSAKAMGDAYGFWGYAAGFAIGLAGAVGAIFLFAMSVATAIGLCTGNPEYPVCRQGVCRSLNAPDSDFRYEDLEGVLIARCRCGDVYVKRWRRVLLLRDDGMEIPYMIWNPILGWRAERVQSPTP